MRKLYYTTGSPYARAVRIVLHEKGLAFDSDETVATPSVEERARVAPTLQVPTLVDGAVRLWDSAVILEYLMATYPNAPAPAGQLPLVEQLVRPERRWQDQLALATLATLGVSIVTISQLHWSGLPHEQNSFATRSAQRIQHLLDWFETELTGTTEGFVPGALAVQDILLAVWTAFMDKRPILKLTWRTAARPKIAALHDRLAARPSFAANPVYFWEPGIVAYTATGEPIRG